MATISGGTKLEAALKRIAGGLDRATSVKIGFLAEAKYEDGTTPVALVAALNDFGVPSKSQPPRPFFRDMIAAKSPEWPGAVADTLKAANYDAAKALDAVGEVIGGQLRESIREFNRVPLPPATVKKKGFAKPLIDVGIMIGSVGHRVD